MKYKIGEENFERKHFWLPCVISADLAGMTDEEKARIYNATRWADLITNAEWPVLLQDVRNAPVKSRLKKKIVHWLMAMGRIAVLNPELMNAALCEARDLYAEQLRETHPLMIEISRAQHSGWYLVHLFDPADGAA